MGESRRSSGLRQVELIDAALHIIATRGVAALSTRSLAEQVGLSSGAIFRHFASLEALLDAVVVRVESVLESTYPSKELSALERLEHFVKARSAAVGERVGILRLVVSEQFLLALPKSGSARLAACVQKTRKFVLQCLQEAQAAGEIRRDVGPRTLATMVMGTTQMLALSTGSARQRAVEAKAVWQGVRTLLQPPAAPSSTGRRRTK